MAEDNSIKSIKLIMLILTLVAVGAGVLGGIWLVGSAA